MEEPTTELRREPVPPPPWYREHWWIFLVVLLLIVGGIIAFFALRDRGGGGEERRTVPDVVGLREAQARATLEDEGFSVDVVREQADEPEMTVVEQDPAAGSSVPTGSRVTITVSTGPQETQTETETVTETETETETETAPPETVEMPDAVGQDYAEAAAAVFDAGLIADTYPTPSDEPRGTVIAQNPAAGEEVERGSVVRLNVALGSGDRPPREVPDMTGPALADAHEQCRDAGFTCRTVYRDAPSAEEVGEVIDQAPAAGASTPELSQITLFTGR